MSFTIRKKIIASFMGAVIIPLLIIVVIMGISISRYSINTYHENSRKVLERISDHYSSFINETKANTHLISDSPLKKEIHSTMATYLDNSEPVDMDYLDVGGVEAAYYSLTKLIHGSHENYIEVYMATRNGAFNHPHQLYP